MDRAEIKLIDANTRHQPSAEAMMHHKAAPYGFMNTHEPNVVDTASSTNNNRNINSFESISNTFILSNTTNLSSKSHKSKTMDNVECKETKIKIATDYVEITICNIEKGSGEKILGMVLQDGSCHIKHVKTRCDKGLKIVFYLTCNKTFKNGMRLSIGKTIIDSLIRAIISYGLETIHNVFINFHPPS